MWSIGISFERVRKSYFYSHGSGRSPCEDHRGKRSFPLMQALEFLSFGCHNLTGGSSRRESIRLIHCAMDHGIKRFDVAPSYGMGTAESVLGIAIRKRSADLEVTTKFGIEPPRFGRLLAWGRTPYRVLRQITREGPSPLPGNLTGAQGSPLRLRKSLERSLRALNIDCVHTLLTHELIDLRHLAEQLDDLEFGLNRGMLNWFGCSGEREVVGQMLSIFCRHARVVQVSISDVGAFGTHSTIRCFGAVRIMAPQICRHANLDGEYRDQLLAVFAGVKSSQECFALAAIVAARALFPRTTLLVTTSNEARICDIARFLSNQAVLDWGKAYSAVHRGMLVNRAQV
jgi:predicted oxidoreductase